MLQKWTDSRIAEACAMLAKQMTMKEIGAAMSETRCAVSGMINRLKMANDPRLPANRNVASRPFMHGSTRLRIQHFSERLSEHGDVKTAAREIGVGEDCGWKYYGIVKAELGWQAV